LSAKILDEETDEDEALISLEVSEDEELVEESSEKAEPKGNFNFLNLDEIDAFKEQLFPAGSLFEPAKDWKERQKQFDNAREYTVSGLITEMILRDGKNSGEKICFLTLEDYTGSYSFRLGDRDYMKFVKKLPKIVL
jgi:DNA polymerase-3 subunit alpha